MKKYSTHIGLILLTTVILSFAAKLDMQPKRVYGLPKEGNHVKIKDSFLYVDSLKLHLYTIPKVRDLHTVAKTVIGKWAKMYTTIKIEESGNDGQNSYYAKAYYNLVGMRYPYKRKSTVKRMGNDYYAVYEHWYDGMLDFKYYIEYMEGSFYRKNGRYPENEKEFIYHIYGSYNIYSKWLNDVLWILRHFKYR